MLLYMSRRCMKPTYQHKIVKTTKQIPAQTNRNTQALLNIY